MVGRAVDRYARFALDISEYWAHMTERRALVTEFRAHLIENRAYLTDRMFGYSHSCVCMHIGVPRNVGCTIDRSLAALHRALLTECGAHLAEYMVLF